MHSGSEIETGISDLARNRVLEYLQTERQAVRSVVTLVDVTEETALAPEAVEAVMMQLEKDVEVPVRRATADQLRWHIRR